MRDESNFLFSAIIGSDRFILVKIRESLIEIQILEEFMKRKVQWFYFYFIFFYTDTEGQKLSETKIICLKNFDLCSTASVNI